MHPYVIEIVLFTALALSTEAVFTGIADFLHRLVANLRKLKTEGRSLSLRAFFARVKAFFRNVLQRRRERLRDRRRIETNVPKDEIDWKLPCRTSLWSIPVYAVSATFAFGVMEALYPEFFARDWWVRGIVYMICTFVFEYLWGLILEEATGECPWHYRDSKWRIWRYINPEYAALWFFFGFALEWIHLEALPVAVAAFS